MKDCSTCANQLDKCFSMQEPFNDCSCFMSKQDRIKCEQEIIMYSLFHDAPDAARVASENIKRIRRA